MDLQNLTRQELKNHLRARDLATTGIKTRLVERLQASVLEEQASTDRVGGGWVQFGCYMRHRHANKRTELPSGDDC